MKVFKVPVFSGYRMVSKLQVILCSFTVFVGFVICVPLTETDKDSALTFDKDKVVPFTGRSTGLTSNEKEMDSHMANKQQIPPSDAANKVTDTTMDKAANVASVKDNVVGFRNEDVALYETNSIGTTAEEVDKNPGDNCNVTIDKRSINYFRSRLQIDDPNFIRFKIVFGNASIGHTDETLYAWNWVWTYYSSNGIYPYLHWNVDYGTLSFKLLDVKTLDHDPYIAFKVGNCTLTLGTRETTEKLAEQLKVLVSELSVDNKTITKYQESYWCYMAEAPGFRETLGYLMGLYFLYPISIINYNCCLTYFNYSATQYEYECLDKQMDKWIQCTIGPYILGVILFLYFPFILLKTASWKAAGKQLGTPVKDGANERTSIVRDTDKTKSHDLDGNDWVYLDGSFPKSFMGLLASAVPDRCPTALSRFKRFLFVLLGPSVIFIQLWIYCNQTGITRAMTRAIIAKGVPVGFLSLLGNNQTEMAGAFAPFFRGPYVLLSSYYILGILFLVLPSSVHDVIENGIPRVRSTISPLCLNIREILDFSKVRVSNKGGYGSAKNMLLCSFYMLFTGMFWKRAFGIQISRVRDSSCFQARVCRCVFFLLFPLYLVLCMAELLLCVVYYAIPLCSSVVIIVRGAVRTIAIAIRSRVHSPNRNIMTILLRSRLVIGAFSLIVAALFIFYTYCFSLVFIQSFFFLSQILVYCYVAVLVYPAVAFGYIFFGVVLLYYIFRLIRGFGVKYLDLLYDIIEILLLAEEKDNYSSVVDGILVIRNVKISRLRSISINDATIPLAQNALHGLNSQLKKKNRLDYKNNAYGISKDLFDYVVSKHLPVHQQVLKVVFHILMIGLCLTITLSLTAGFITGPTSEMSEVMHVVFIITVGALPRVLEVAMHDSSEHIHHDIKLRRLEDTINEYWIALEDPDEAGPSSFHHVLIHQELPEIS